MTEARRKTTEEPREDVLSTPPFDGDLAEELAAAPRPRRRPPSATVLLGAGVLIVAGFVGGVQADRHWGATKSPDLAALAARFQGRGGAAGGFGTAAGQGGGGFSRGTGNGASGAGTTGTVKLVDGDIIYVQTSDGIVRVKTTGSTKVTIAQKSSVKKLKTGAPVVVQGTPAQDGTVTATSVSQGG